jgi:hypothetical protein
LGPVQHMWERNSGGHKAWAPQMEQGLGHKWGTAAGLLHTGKVRGPHKVTAEHTRAKSQVDKKGRGQAAIGCKTESLVVVGVERKLGPVGVGSTSGQVGEVGACRLGPGAGVARSRGCSWGQSTWGQSTWGRSKRGPASGRSSAQGRGTGVRIVEGRSRWELSS